MIYAIGETTIRRLTSAVWIPVPLMGELKGWNISVLARTAKVVDHRVETASMIASGSMAESGSLLAAMLYTLRINSSASTLRSWSKQLNSGILSSKNRHKRSGLNVVMFDWCGVKVVNDGSDETPSGSFSQSLRGHDENKCHEKSMILFGISKVELF